MQIPDALRKCVCFIQATREDGPWMGTAFFVAVPLGVADAFSAYVVTARHCIDPDDEHEYGPADSIGLRLNTRSGTSVVIDTKPTDWWRHPTADLAVLPLAPDQSVFDWMAIPVDAFATTEFLRKQGFGPGEDLLISGLLVHHPGETRIMPIVRVGNVAAFPEDPIFVNSGAHVAPDVVALAEVRSIGGLSGCPAFIHPGDLRSGEQGLRIGTSGTIGGPNYLLGVMHGFFVVGDNDPDGVVPRADEEEINTGISVVVLADRILEILYAPEVQTMRDEAATAARKQSMPRAATAKPTGGTAEFDRFEDLTRQLVNTPKPSPEDG